MKLKSCHVIYIFNPFSLDCETQNIKLWKSDRFSEALSNDFLIASFFHES